MTEQAHRYPFTVGAEITIVGHGYQIDVTDASRATSDGNGAVKQSACRDFGGDHDEAEVAGFVAEKLIEFMDGIETRFEASKKPGGVRWDDLPVWRRKSGYWAAIPVDSDSILGAMDNEIVYVSFDGKWHVLRPGQSKAEPLSNFHFLREIEA